MPPRVERITYDELAEDLRQHYRITERRDLEEAGYRLAHLDRFFGAQRAATIDDPRVTAYIAHRQAAGAANGTMNRELGVLSRMLRLAVKNKKAMALPSWESLKEAKPRQGFFEDDEYAAVTARLVDRPDLQVAVAIAQTYRWRMQSEVLVLERRQVDLKAGMLTLDDSKNDDGRLVYLTPALAAMLAEQLARVDALSRRLGRIVPYVFPHLGPEACRAPASRTSGRRGRGPVGRPGSPGSTATTSAGLRCGT